VYERLRQMVGVPIRTIHVVRNPFDNISTIFLKGRNKNFQESIDYYFFLADEVLRLKRIIPAKDLMEVYHEDFIRDARLYLRQLTDFLGVESSPEYLDACNSIVFSKPHQTRHDAPWTEETIASVTGRIRDYPFLTSYSFEK
jgi:hypothetical protein